MSTTTPLPPPPTTTPPPLRSRNPLRWFAPAPHRPPLANPHEIDRVYRRSRTSVICSITLAYGFLYTCRLGLSVVKKPLLDAGLFSATDLGQIGAAMFYSYALGKLVNGFLADHADVRKFFAAGMACSAVVNLLMGFSPLFWIWVLLWGLNGWFQGFGGPACAVSLSNWFSPRERGRYYGIWSLSHSIGEGLTFVVSGLLVAYLGWRSAFVGPALLCLATSAALLVFLKDRPQSQGLPDISTWQNSHTRAFPVVMPPSQSGTTICELGTPPPSPSPTHSPYQTLLSQLSLLRRPTLWILGLSSATMYVSRYAINNWGVLFLQDAKGYSLVQATSLLALNNLTGMAGAVAYGYLSDSLFHARRPPVTLLFGLAETASLATILFCPPGHPILLSAAFAIFGFTLSGLLAVLGGLFAIDLVPKHATGAVMGMIGAFSYLGAATQDTLTGLLLDHHKTMTPAGTPHYDFTPAALFWLASSLLSLLLASTLWRAKPKS